MPMESAEINLRQIKTVVNTILDHLIEDLRMDSVPIDAAEDLYLEYPFPQAFDVSKRDADLDVGRLKDDVELIQKVSRGRGGDVSYNLVHVAPLLRYIAEKVRR